MYAGTTVHGGSAHKEIVGTETRVRESWRQRTVNHSAVKFIYN